MKKELLSSTSLVYLSAPPLARQRGHFVYGDKAVQSLTDLGRSLGKSATITEQFKDMLANLLDEGYNYAQAAALIGNMHFEERFKYDASRFERTDEILEHAYQRVIRERVAENDNVRYLDLW
ncbi:hypothetical protein EVC12_111 [Rhizobium phage RHph_I42]|nr:hypothetical protein EVC12_111 [Rhizobium phage RHph_I42]